MAPEVRYVQESVVGESQHSEDVEELEIPLIGDADSLENGPSSSVPRTWKFKSIEKFVSIYADQSGSCVNVTKGISLILAIGAFIGALLPKDPDLPTPWYRVLSSSIGYVYFLSWSVSFYPQLITNYQKKATDGLSTEAYILAILNYTCYTIYNVFFFYNEGIRQEYKDRYGPESTITVESNDVAFSIHALFLNILLLGQIAYYGMLAHFEIANGMVRKNMSFGPYIFRS